MNKRWALALLLAAFGCVDERQGTETVLLLSVETDGGEAPSHIVLRWAANGQLVAEGMRIPARGNIMTAGPQLGTVSIALNGPGPRTIVGIGYRGDQALSEGTVQVDAVVGLNRATLRLDTGRRPDADSDGFPDEVDNCPAEDNPSQGPCAADVTAPRDDAAQHSSSDPGVPDQAPAGDAGAEGSEAGVVQTDTAMEDAGPIAAPAGKLKRGKACKGPEECESGSCAEARAGRFCASLDMVAVPAGAFTRGCDPGTVPVCAADEQPSRIVTLKGFEIDRVEVTQGAYDACVRAGKCTPPATSWKPSARAKHPVTGVSWSQADAHCRFVGKRLPTEAEWEKAARGSADRRLYPWGDEPPSCTNTQWKNCGLADVIPVGILSGTSPYGAEDMAGNASEWVSDFYDPGYYQKAPAVDPAGPSTGTTRVRRGGGFSSDAPSLRVTARASGDASAVSGQGFRCAQTLP